MPSGTPTTLYPGHGTNRRFFLPRLAPPFYRGDAVIHWTMPVAMRATGWLNETFHARFRETMLHAAAREGLFCPAYCLMPDHSHLLWMGLRRDSDQRNGMKFYANIWRRHCNRITSSTNPTTTSCVTRSANGAPLPKSVFTFFRIRFAPAWSKRKKFGLFAALSFRAIPPFIF